MEDARQDLEEMGPLFIHEVDNDIVRSDDETVHNAFNVNRFEPSSIARN